MLQERKINEKSLPCQKNNTFKAESPAGSATEKLLDRGGSDFISVAMLDGVSGNNGNLGSRGPAGGKVDQ